MLKRGRIVLPVFALVLLLAAVLAPQIFTAVSVDDKAPDFTLPKVTGGGDVSLDKINTKPTLLVFWASWCPHCQREMPVLQDLYKDLKSKGMNAVGVSVDKDLNDAKGFVKELDLTFPNAFAGTDQGKKVISSYGLRGVPTVYVLDKGGVIKARYLGGVDEDAIRKEFADLGVK